MANDILVKVGADISDFSKKMAESQRTLKTFATANQQTFESFKKVGTVATAAGVTIAAGLGFAVKKAADFESGMSEVAAISGATGSELNDLKDTAIEWGGSTSFSASEAAAGMEKLALAGWGTNQIMEGLGPVLHLAEAGNMALDRSAELVTNSMAGMGLEVNELDGYLDKVAKTSSNADTDIDQLMEAFVTAGATLDRLNVPLEESSSLFGIMADKGFKGSEAGTAVNAIMSRLTKSTGPAADELDKMGVSVFDADGNFRGLESVLTDVSEATSEMTDEQRENALTQIAGLNHGKSFSAMLGVTGDKYGELKGQVEDSTGALEKMRDIMKDNLAGALEELSSGFETMAIAIGEALLPAVKVLVGGLQMLVNWFNGLSDSTQSTIAIVAAIAAAFLLVVGPMLIMVGLIPLIIAGFTALGTVLAVIVSPVGLVIAALVAVGAAFVYLWTTSEKFRNIIIGVFEAVKEIVTPILQSIVDFVMDLWGGLVSWWLENNEMILQAAQNVWNVIEAVINGVMVAIGAIMQAMWPIIKALVIDTWNAIKNTIQGAIDVILGIVDFFAALFTGNWSKMWDATKQIFSGALQLVWGLVNLWFVGKILKVGKVFAKGLQSVIKGLWSAIKSIFTGGVNVAKNVVNTGFNFIKSIVTGAMNAIKSVISSVWNGIKSVTSSTVSAIKNVVRSGFNAVKSSTSSIVTGMKNKIVGVWNSLKTKTASIFNSLKSKITSPLKSINLLSIGKNIINGLINGIKSKVSAVAGAVKDVASKITGKIKSILGIKSPSRVLKKLGVFTGQGLEIGISSMAGKVGKAAAGLADAATPDMGRVNMAYATPSGVKSSLSSAVNGTVDVNTRDDMLAGAIGDLRRDLTNLRVEMDGRTVGRIVEPHVSQTQDLKKRTRDSFAGRG